MSRQGKVTGLFIYHDAHSSGKCVTRVEVVKGEGICGDRHADGGERQISLRDAGLKGEQGICFHKFKANIQIEGIDFTELSPGIVLTIGSAKLKITSCRKRCYQEECMIYKNAKDCPVTTGCLFATVLQSGTITDNQPVLICNNAIVS